MKMSKKIVALTAIAAMVVTAVPVSQSLSEVKAAAFTALAKYDFESGTGMSSSGIGGTAPSVVNDSERGNVLEFADGSNSEVVTAAQDSNMENHSYSIKVGSPSSLKFANPFKGKNLSGATIAMWVKVPTEKAAGITSTGEVDKYLNVASGLVGFVDSEERKLVHPDAEDGGHSDQIYSGRTFFGINAQPAIYFNQIHHNSIVSYDTEATLADFEGVWKYLAVAITNDDVTYYVDGKEIVSSKVSKGKRFKSAKEHDTPGNDGMPYLLNFLADKMSYTFGGKAGTFTFKDKNSGKDVSYGEIPSNVECYVGFTGFSGTQSGVRIDDLAFFNKAYSANEMASLFEAAKSGDIGVGGSGPSNDSTTDTAKGMSEDEALENAKSFHTVAGDIVLTDVTPIMESNSAYAALKTIVDNGITTVVALNPEWSNLKIRRSQIYNFNFTGSGELEGDVPAGWNATSTWVLYIDEAANTVTKCDATITEAGKLRFVPKTAGKYVLAEMATSTSTPKGGVVSTGLFVLLGASAVAGGGCMLKRKKED